MYTFVHSTKAGVSIVFLKKTLNRILLDLGKKKIRNKSLLNSELTLVFASPLEMKSLNSQYRGKNKVTDVLSFMAQPDFTSKASTAQAAKSRTNAKSKTNPKSAKIIKHQISTQSLGELVLCPQEIKKRGKFHKLTYQEELTYNLIHGILHLLGYDHEESKKEEKIMFKIQDELFEQMR